MAAITNIISGLSNFNHIRTATAQATTGQTDWLAVPHWAKYALVYFNLSANAGTTPTTTLSFLAADPIALDDGEVMNVAAHAALTAITGAAQYIIQMGPGVTGIADDTTNAAAADDMVSLNVVLPTILGIKILNDRGSANETYTYKLSVQFRG